MRRFQHAGRVSSDKPLCPLAPKSTEMAVSCHLEALHHMAPRDKSNSEPHVPGSPHRNDYSYAVWLDGFIPQHRVSGHHRHATSRCAMTSTSRGFEEHNILRICSTLCRHRQARARQTTWKGCHPRDTCASGPPAAQDWPLVQEETGYPATEWVRATWSTR